MKRKILILILVSFIFVSFSNFTFAQDTGVPDTVWLSIVPMTQTWNPIYHRPFHFAVECSAAIDESLSAMQIPISFYHSQNLDIIADSIKFSAWFTSIYPSIIGSLFQNDSVTSSNYTPKSFLVSAIWFTPGQRFYSGSGRGLLFTVYFNSDYNQVPHWDTTKSIVLDTIYSYPAGTRIRLTDAMANPVSFNPIFRYGVIGDTVVISGTAYQSDGTTPDVGKNVYCRGKEVYGSYFPGRVLTDKTDGSGNFRFVVGKGGDWNVFRDTTGGLVPGTNAFCFDSLIADTSGLVFKGYTDVEEEKEKDVAIPEKFTVFQNYPNPFNPNTVIKFYVPEDSWVKVEVFNLLGQKVRTLADKAMKKGIKKIIWNGKNEKGAEVSSGIYFYRIKTDESTGVKKMILIK